MLFELDARQRAHQDVLPFVRGEGTDAQQSFAPRVRFSGACRSGDGGTGDDDAVGRNAADGDEDVAGPAAGGDDAACGAEGAAFAVGDWLRCASGRTLHHVRENHHAQPGGLSGDGIGGTAGEQPVDEHHRSIAHVAKRR